MVCVLWFTFSKVYATINVCTCIMSKHQYVNTIALVKFMVQMTDYWWSHQQNPEWLIDMNNPVIQRIIEHEDIYDIYASANVVIVDSEHYSLENKLLSEQVITRLLSTGPLLMRLIYRNGNYNTGVLSIFFFMISFENIVWKFFKACKAPNRWQAITWSNDDSNNCNIYTSPALLWVKCMKKYE